MGQLEQASVHNILLRTMSEEDFALLQPHLTALPLPASMVLFEAHQPIEHVYFVESGVVSVVAKPEITIAIEIGIIGKEGMAGTPLLLGSDRSPNQTFVQVPGAALFLTTERFLDATRASRAMHGLCLRYVHAFMSQISQTAYANASGVIEERLARWLLMCQDRLDSTVIELTHGFLSNMLGVRRSGVTEALQALESRGMIRAQRGRITVLDRAKLLDIAGPSYGGPEAEYLRLIGNGATTD